MAKCNNCEQEMKIAKTCLIEKFSITRLKYGQGDEVKYITKESHPTCHDCNVEWGGYHHFGCDMENCPICGEQLIGCGHGELFEPITN